MLRGKKTGTHLLPTTDFKHCFGRPSFWKCHAPYHVLIQLGTYWYNRVRTNTTGYVLIQPGTYWYNRVRYFVWPVATLLHGFIVLILQTWLPTPNTFLLLTKVLLLYHWLSFVEFVLGSTMLFTTKSTFLCHSSRCWSVLFVNVLLSALVWHAGWIVISHVDISQSGPNNASWISQSYLFYGRYVLEPSIICKSSKLVISLDLLICICSLKLSSQLV